MVGDGIGWLDDEEAVPVYCSQSVPRRRLVDVENPFEKLQEAEFVERYRFTKAGVKEIFECLKHDVMFQTRSNGLHPILQLTIALRFYAAGHFQMTDGDLLGVSRRTAGRSIHRVSRVITRNKVCFMAPIN